VGFAYKVRILVTRLVFALTHFNGNQACWKCVSVIVSPILSSSNGYNIGAGTNLEAKTCPKFGTGVYDPCYAAFLSLHITPSATGYFEVCDSLSPVCCVSIAIHSFIHSMARRSVISSCNSYAMV